MTKYVDMEYGQICISTGEVLELRESVHISSSSTTSHGAYNSSTSHSTSSTTTLKLAVREADGTEQHLALSEALQVGIRTGNKVTVIWFVPKGKKSGDYVLAYNHDSRDKRVRRVSVFNQTQGCLTVLAFIAVIGLFFTLSIIGLLLLAPVAWWLYKKKQQVDAIMERIEAEFEIVRNSA